MLIPETVLINISMGTAATTVYMNRSTGVKAACDGNVEDIWRRQFSISRVPLLLLYTIV